MKDTLFSVKKTLNIGGKLHISEYPLIMGVLNITPDSFYSGSRFSDEKPILSEAENMLKHGAFAIDVGGYSSRPGAIDISAEEETERVVPVIRLLTKKFPEAVISIDTFRSSVAERAIDEGAALVNDISGGELDENMFAMVARRRIPYILMHMKGNPGNMTSKAEYDNLFKEIAVYFNRRVKQLNGLGLSDLILDPGFGFAKTIGQNYEILKNLSYFTIFGLPIMVGLSRKSMVYRTLKVDPEQALNGTTIINTLALLNKASILRVHDVKEANEIVSILRKVSFDISD